MSSTREQDDFIQKTAGDARTARYPPNQDSYLTTWAVEAGICSLVKATALPFIAQIASRVHNYGAHKTLPKSHQRPYPADATSMFHHSSSTTHLPLPRVWASIRALSEQPLVSVKWSVIVGSETLFGMLP